MCKYKIGETIYFIKEQKVVHGAVLGIVYVTNSGEKNSFYYTIEPLDKFKQLYIHNCVREDLAFPTKEDLIKSL